MKKAVALLSLLALLFVAYAGWKFSNARSVQLFGRLVDRVDTPERVVALTFDDGPTPEGTDSVLAALGQGGVSATFFLTGAELAEHPELGRRIAAAGHEIGNHTWSHQRMLLRSPGFIRREIEDTDSLIRATGYRGEILFRPPYGKKLVGLPWYLARRDRTSVMWDVEPDSYAEVASSAPRIVQHVLEEARPGSIILLHVMYPSRRESLRAVPGIIQGLRERGYRFVTVSELLQE